MKAWEAGEGFGLGSVFTNIRESLSIWNSLTVIGDWLEDGATIMVAEQRGVRTKLTVVGADETGTTVCCP